MTQLTTDTMLYVRIGHLQAELEKLKSDSEKKEKQLNEVIKKQNRVIGALTKKR